MLEDQVAFLLQRFLGNYVSGLSKEALKISVWNGDVELTNMQLKPEALNALKLPVKVKAGFLGSVKLQVPWSRLGQDPVLVYLDRIFLLAEPATHVEGYSEDAVQEAKKSRVREMEMKLLERARQLKSEVNKSWLGSLINTIIGNLKLSISNIHVRYEDLESNPGHPFAAGVTLGKLSAVTVDGSGAETFLTGGALDHIQKSVELDQLSIYLDSDISPWYVDKPWEELLPPEWVQVFRFGTKDGKPADTIVKKHSYVLQPVSGNAKYSKLRPDELANSGQPLQKAVVNLDDVTLCLSKDGYSNVLKLADNFAAFNQRLKYAHYRPFVSLKSDPRAWWKYAYKAVSDQMKKASGKLSWEQVLRFTRLRKRYISLYASLLKSDPNRAVIDNNKEIEELDRELDIELILQWRMLAHKVVERSTESDLYQQKAKKSWWSFGWNTQSFKDESEQFHLNDDDWEKLNKIIGYKEGEDEQSSIMNERKDILHMYLEVHMKHNASRLVSGAEECLADLSCDDLDCSIKLYPESKIFDMKLGSYRLSSPNGLLAESATSYDSLIAIFRYKPFDAKVDWSMVAKASPCYMTYLKDSIDDIVKFFETNDGVSQTVALETAAAVQMTIDGVKRSAQQQVNRALKDHARFLLDLDIAAPKITIPTEFHPDNVHSTKLLLDLGNLVIHSKDDYGRSASPELDMYMQFDLILSDVSAFLVDGDYNWSQPSLPESSSSVDIRKTSLLPVVDKCGVIVRLQQIRLENPLYPSTRLAVRLPSLGFHFSPARYHRLMQVAKVFQDRSDDSSFVHPWDRADFEGWISLLIRKGMGNREASWQQRYLCLVGPYLYILESPGSKSYKQYLSLLGKQISLLPADMVGGVNNVIAICDGTRPINKVVEDVNALILQCESEESRRTWQNLLQAAIYRASGSAPITGLSETSSDTEGSETDKESNEAQEILKIEQLFITGILDELKLCFNYSHQTGRNFLKVLLEEESPLFEFRAIGGQVELSIRDNDMFIGTILKSLEIEDLVCCTSISKPCFLARSYIQGFDASNNMSRNKSFDQSNFTFTEDDQFYEAPESLADSESLTSQSLLLLENPSLRTSDFSRVAGLLPGDGNELAKEKVELTDTLNSFIKAQIVKYDQNSSLYRNVDMEVTVTLATLSFFGRRPTIRAILEFVNAINIEEECESFSDSSSTAMVKHDVSKEGISDEQNLKSTEEPVIKGLLGKGKSRIIFNLVLKMARAQILFMNENETTLATLSQDNLLAEIKVFPNSFSIKAALGNLRISDDSLPDTHAYFWICDMRNPGGSSFVELIFTSFSADDEDYEGFDYSLVGELSEVRLVYLNRFIQEVVGYFMGLIPSSSEGVVKLKDQVTNSEKWFTTSEIAGSPALKLDLSLRKPIILMPRRTDSPDYLKLDVVHITVENTFQWIYGSKEEMNAVHMEMLTVKVEDINLNVGSGSELSESIIKDVKGVSIVIQRSLRDLLHQIPSVEASVMIEALKAALSNKEYQIITECAVSNVSENPNVVPPLNYGSELHSDNVEEPTIAQDLVSPESDTLHTESWISIKVAVMINLVELCLHAGVARDASLATLQISGAWLLYKSTNLGDGFLSATLKGFSVIDDREGTDEEFRLAIGNREKIDYGHLESQSVGDGRQIADKNAKTEDEIKPTPTMLILDAKFSQSTVISLCVQRPQLLVALDFLLAVAEFFVPTIGDVLSNGKNNGPINVFDAIVLHESVFSQPSAEFSLSPLKPLIIDDERFEHFVYDGKGGTLCLKDREGNDLSEPSKEPIIYVESRKKLQFKDVIVKNGMYLDSCISLGSDSAYSASEDDRVYLKGAEAVTSMDSPTERNDQMPSHGNAGARSTEFIIELQAIGPELTFYNATRDVEVSYMLSNKLLHAQLDVFARLVLMGDTVELTANALGLMMESNGIRILEPFDTSVKYSNASGKTNIHISVSDIFMNLTFSILRLFLAVEEDILTFLRMTSKKITVTCYQFDKVGTVRNLSNDQTFVFWRPRSPRGFAVLGDYLTPMDKPPTKGVIAVNTNFAIVKRPISFKKIWPSSDVTRSSNPFSKGSLSKEDESCSIWFPEAPKGYVAMGCAVSTGRTPPPLSSAFCVLASLVSSCPLRDCITISSTNLCSAPLAFWRVDNSAGSFLPADPVTLNLACRPYELRHIKFGLPESSPKLSEVADAQSSPSEHVDGIQLERPSTATSGRQFEAIASFQLIWWNQASSSTKRLSIWRPIVPEGMVYFGDIAVRGYEPPNSCIVLHDAGDGELFKAPIDFQLVGQIRKQRGVDSISLWMPQPPPGFVSLGCIACKGSPRQHDFCKLRCLRSDMVTGDQFLEESVWDTSDAKFGTGPFSIWTTGNELGTFIVRSGFRKPPKRFALKLADPTAPSGSDDAVIDADLRTISAAIFDDYAGLMVPLFNISLSGIGFSLHGRADYLNSTASFSLAARSYNDKYESWEPLVEPVDGFVRYQYDLNSPGAASQLRLTSTKNLNLNVTVSNANMVTQAYASWNSLSLVNEPHKKSEEFSLTYGARSVVDVHHKKNNYIIPQNKIGQDIFIRATEMGSLSKTIKMPSGDMKPVKVPVSMNMLDSHLEGKLCVQARMMVTVVVVDAQFPNAGGLASNLYTVAIRLTPSQTSGSDPLLHQQSARTSGSVATSSNGLELVNWNEMFFFKVDSLDNCLLELIVTDVGRGTPVGLLSVPVTQISEMYEESFSHLEYMKYLRRIDLSAARSMSIAGGVGQNNSSRSIRCAVLLSSPSEIENSAEGYTVDKKPGFIQISPGMEGPWTTVRLNYAAAAAAWRFGNDVIASEVSVKDGNRYVNIRSIVSVHNNTNFVLHLCLASKASIESIGSVDNANIAEVQQNDSRVESVEFFEIEKYDPAKGWVGLLNFSDGERHQANFEVELPSGWEWIDDWKVDLSSPTTSDGWVYAPDVDSLKWPESYDPSQSVNYARMRRWNRNRIKAVGDPKSKLHVGILNPGETLPLPLAYLTQTEQYILQLRPLNPDEYSWSYVVDRLGESENSDKSSSLCVSSLIESEELLFCNQTTGSSSGGNRKLWFFVSIQPTEIAKDIRSEPIHDWHIIVKSPLSISNYLPMAAEYSILDILPTGHFVACSRGVFAPGKTVNIHTADIRRSLFLSLRPQKGWIPIHDAVLISQPHGLPSRTMSLRSAISGRIVQLILEQTYEKESPLMEKMIRVYAPYWFSIAKCPLLRCRLVELSGKRHSRKLAKPFQSKKNSEILTGEITEEEIHDGHTIASALNFKLLGLQVAIAQSAEEQHYGPIKDLSSLGDMDGSLDLFAYDADGNCLHLFISTKTCPYQSVPTKVISIRPYMTFTNRLGQDMYIKQSTEDEPKILHAFDSRISYMWRKAHEADKFQFKLEDTEWSYPIQVTKEDSIVIVLRRQNNTRTFLKIEIRGFEEGSRFIVVFRLGSSSVPIRIENRTASKSIRIRQTGFSDDSWIRMEPCSTAKFYWEDPYGQKFIDAEIDSGVVNGTWKLDLETNGMSSVEGAELGLQFHVAEMGDLKVATFTDFVGSHMQPEPNSVLAAGNGGALHKQGEMQNVNSPMEVIVELGVVGISIVDHRPKELSYLYLERVFVSYSTGYDGGTTSRFKIILGYLQLDNQLPLTLLPVLLAPDHNDHTHQPVFKMTITQRNMNTDGVQVYPYVYIRVTEDVWRLSIHEPIIWAMVDFYGKLHLDRLPQDSTITEVDPEIRIELIDVSEVRLKISLETAPAQRPAGVLGIWSPVLSAVGNAFKIQVHLRRVMHKDRFMRKSSIIPAIGNRIWRDLIHNPLHLIFSVDVLGMTSSTLASLSKGFAELSTDGQFLQLRSKQLGSRRITGVGAGIIHGTEALAQGVAFGVSGVVTKPVESARENGILGLAHGLGRAFLGVIVQPVSGALDFFSLTIDGIGASCSKCLEVFNSKSTSHRIRNPRAIRADAILREYSEREAAGQMVLGLAEASRQFGCTEIFKEPSKFALTDYYEDHFPVPYQRVALVTNKRVMLLQSPAPEKMDKKPSKIMWDVPWEELMALELAKAGFQQPSHVLLHLKHFRRSESFVRVIKCSVEEESEGSEPQAIRICVTIRKMWKAYQSDTKCLALKVPSSQRYVHFAWNESDGKQSYRSSKGIIKSRELSSSGSVLSGRFVKHSMNFQKIWSSEQQPKGRCKLCQKQVEENRICSIWRPICPEGYVSIGDVAHVGVHAPNVAAVYRRIDNMFADPVGYDLVWRNCADDYKSMVSIWHPRAPDGYVSPGCVAVAGFEEPEPNLVSCVAESLTEQTEFEEKVWSAPDAYPWACHFYQIRSDALHFVVLRQRKDDSDWKPMRIIDDPNHRSQTAEAQ